MNESIITSLSKHGKLEEVCRVYVFEGYRGGGLRDTGDLIEVQILDRGAKCGDLNNRYFCRAINKENGQEATGNPDSTVENAITDFNWAKLD